MATTTSQRRHTLWQVVDVTTATTLCQTGLLGDKQVQVLTQGGMLSGRLEQTRSRYNTNNRKFKRYAAGQRKRILRYITAWQKRLPCPGSLSCSHSPGVDLLVPHNTGQEATAC